MRETILFIDHAFHKKTQSSSFFTDRLLIDFDLVTVHIEPNEGISHEIIRKSITCDYIVLWQMDYLAPVFLALGKRVIVVPMYDGSGSMPALHWIFQKDARLINFSLTLHLSVVKLGLCSKYVQYFKEAVPADQKVQFDEGLRVFFWQRRPEHGLTVDVVDALLGDQIRYLHVHNVPDLANYDRRVGSLNKKEGREVCVTDWFESQDDYLAALSKCNTFICPRLSEGIGMAMLEAMSRGMLVLAADQPSHNEYIANWINGILFDPSRVGFAHVGSAAESVAHQAWLSAVIGRERWLEDLEQVIEYVRATPHPPAIVSTVDEAHNFSEKLSLAYYSNGRYGSFLRANKLLISRLARVSERQLEAMSS